MKAIFTDEWKYVYNYKLAEYEPLGRLKMAWRENDWNYLFNYTSVFELLFNRTNDLEDKVNLVSDHAALGDKLKERLNQWVETAPKYPPKKVEVNPSQEIVDNGGRRSQEAQPEGGDNCDHYVYPDRDNDRGQ